MFSNTIALSDEEFLLLNEVIEQNFGICFVEQTRRILEARLTPRLRQLQLATFMDYYLLLQTNGHGEIRQLARLATNNETYFFREPYQFEALFNGGIELLKPGLAVPGTIRVLCAGCSSGEEPYTIKIFSTEHQRVLTSLTLRVDAFDIDDDRLDIAKRADCRPRSLRDMSQDQIDRYLDETGEDRFTVKPEYRVGVNFSYGNIVEVSTFRNPLPYDVVFCRNVLIYFSDATLRRAIDNFAQVLRPGGLLFLGHSETIIGLTARFETVRVNNVIAYRRTAA